MKTRTGRTRDEILVDEIGRLVPFFGKGGAKLAARLLRTDTKSTEIELQLSTERAFEVATHALSNLGRLLADDGGVQSTGLKSVVGSGRLNLNPALVEIEIKESRTGGAVLCVTASAKEGLHNQNTAANAIERVVARLIE